MVKRASEDLNSFQNEFKSALDEDVDRIRIRVMVFGPNTDSNGSGAELRKFIIEQCSAHNTVVRSEYQKLIDIHKKKLGSTHNLCSMEYKAAQMVDGIIILPDSAGSLVELGMFALSPHMHEKIMILFSHVYQDLDRSFVGLGPKLMYDKIGGASVGVIDYEMKEVAWSIIHEFLLVRKERKRWRLKK